MLSAIYTVYGECCLDTTRIVHVVTAMILILRNVGLSNVALPIAFTFRLPIFLVLTNANACAQLEVFIFVAFFTMLQQL
jgi:hypothetical protein